MSKSLSVLLLTAGLTTVPVLATTLPIGGVSLDPYNTSGATFDITNLTGLLSSTYPDPSAPVSTQLTFSDILLTIDYQGGGIVTEGQDQFVDDGFGGFLGTFDVTAAGLPILNATLTGVDSPGHVTLNDGNVAEIAQTFSAILTSGSCDTLSIGDAVTIDVTQIPEPVSAGFLGVALAGLAVVRRRKGARDVA